MLASKKPTSAHLRPFLPGFHYNTTRQEAFKSHREIVCNQPMEPALALLAAWLQLIKPVSKIYICWQNKKLLLFNQGPIVLENLGVLTTKSDSIIIVKYMCALRGCKPWKGVLTVTKGSGLCEQSVAKMLCNVNRSGICSEAVFCFQVRVSVSCSARSSMAWTWTQTGWVPLSFGFLSTRASLPRTNASSSAVPTGQDTSMSLPQRFVVDLRCSHCSLSQKHNWI